jgi:hypothetical protein
MWRRVPHLRTEASEENIASIIRVKRIIVLGNLAVTRKWITSPQAVIIIKHVIYIDRLYDQVGRVPDCRSCVRFPALPDLLKSSGSGTGSVQPRKDN